MFEYFKFIFSFIFIGSIVYYVDDVIRESDGETFYKIDIAKVERINIEIDTIHIHLVDIRTGNPLPETFTMSQVFRFRKDAEKYIGKLTFKETSI